VRLGSSEDALLESFAPHLNADGDRRREGMPLSWNTVSFLVILTCSL